MCELNTKDGCKLESEWEGMTKFRFRTGETVIVDNFNGSAPWPMAVVRISPGIISR